MKDKKKSRGGRPLVARIDKTTSYDTITMAQWHKFRNEERERYLKEKAEEQEES